METYDMIMWIPKLLFLAVTVVVIIFISTAFALKDLETDELELSLLVEQIYNSNIMYRDPITKRVYPGVIDMDRFRGEWNIQTERDDLALKIELKDNTGTETRYWTSFGENNFQMFERAKADIASGKGTEYSITKPVLKNNKKAELVFTAIKT